MNKRLVRIKAVALFFCLFAAATGFAAENLVFKVSNGSIVNLPSLVHDLAKADLVFFGESHTSRDHHLAQLKLIRLLNERGLKLSVAMEMFNAGDQQVLDDWLSGKAGDDRLKEIFGKSWDLKYWELYRPIFDYAKNKGIHLVALNVDRSIVGKVARDGYNSLSEGDRESIGVLHCEVSDKYRGVLEKALGGKESGGRSFLNFCEAQLVWDSAMAGNINAYAGANPDTMVFVLAGVFHAWRHGIPAWLDEAAAFEIRIILPSSDDQYPKYDVFVEDADYVWWFE